MDITFIVTALGLIGSLITIGGSALSLYRKLLSQIESARSDTEEGKRIAEELVSSATNSEKRADIYLFVTLHAIEIGLRRTKATILNAAFSIFFFILMLSFLWMTKTLDVDYKHPLMILLYITTPLSLVSWGMTIWLGNILQKLEEGWQSGINNALGSRVSKHVGGGRGPGLTI